MTHDPIEFPIVGGFARGGEAKVTLANYEGGESIELMPEPSNPYDENAIKCIDQKSKQFVGYVPKTHNVLVLEAMEEFPTLAAVVMYPDGIKPLIETVVPDAQGEDEEAGT